MEAWIVTIVTVLGFLYTVIFGQESILHWFRRQERQAEDKQMREPATVHVSVRQTLASAIADGITFVQEHPWATLLRTGIGMVATLGSLIVMFLFVGALLWLIGSAFGITDTVTFGGRLMATGGKALGYTFALAIVPGIFVIPTMIVYGDYWRERIESWKEARKAEKEKAKRKAARAAKARARQTVP